MSIPRGKISPSMMCAPLFELERCTRLFEREGIEYLHMDVMDGRFVPNYMLGTDFIRQMRKLSKIPLDIHLMVERPEDILEWFDFQMGEYVSFHFESTVHAQRVCAKIAATGAKPMLALNPATPLYVLEDLLPDLSAILIMTVNPGFAGQKLIPQTLDKIARLKAMLNAAKRPDMEIEVDGNVSEPNAKKMRASGADIFVAGTSSVFFSGRSIEENIKIFRDCIV